SFQRLSAVEVSILYWLAAQDEPHTLAEIQHLLPLPMGPGELVSALDSLKQRSLVEIIATNVKASVGESGTEASTSPRFTMPSLVKAYAIQQFMANFSEGDQRTHAAASTVDSNFAQTDSVQIDRPATLLEPVINLSAGAIAPVQISRWLQSYFESDWQPLDQLFSLSPQPELRLRSVYHWRDVTCVKRGKAIRLGKNNAPELTKEIFLLVAVQQEGENLCRVSVQAQPTQAAHVLPISLTVSLLDEQKTALASVIAQQDDAFIQLPCFRGIRSESFVIEIMLGEYHHIESFVI
ncbi:MAG: DUF1822 family protein, partial [Cyanobacteria bacterium J06598_3]